MAETNLPAEAHVGVELPPDAPREVSQPLTAALLAEHQALARQNEKQLLPLTYGRAVADPKTAEIQELEAKLARLKAEPLGVEAPKPVQAAVVTGSKPTPVEDLSHQPAASNSDSPSRGAPGTAPIPASRKYTPLTVSGGFGESEAEYFPINGQELRTITEQLLDELYARIQNDLRFSVAMVYPRLSIALQLVVEGETESEGFQIQKIEAREKTPLALAQEHGDSVVFVVKQYRREFDDAGNSESPPDAMRDELGMNKPRKQRFGASQKNPGGVIADVAW